jgi:hypothetical protein
VRARAAIVVLLRAPHVVLLHRQDLGAKLRRQAQPRHGGQHLAQHLRLAVALLRGRQRRAALARPSCELARRTLPPRTRRRRWCACSTAQGRARAGSSSRGGELSGGTDSTEMRRAGGSSREPALLSRPAARRRGLRPAPVTRTGHEQAKLSKPTTPSSRAHRAGPSKPSARRARPVLARLAQSSQGSRRARRARLVLAGLASTRRARPVLAGLTSRLLRAAPRPLP